MSWLQTLQKEKWKDMDVNIALLKTLLLREKLILIIIVHVVGLQKKKVPQYPMIKSHVIAAIDFSSSLLFFPSGSYLFFGNSSICKVKSNT